MVIVFELVPAPKYTEPVVPESRVSAPVVLAITERFDAAPEERKRVLSVAIVVAPLPVKVAAPDAKENRVLPEVMKLRALASVVPKTVVVARAFPP
jgi:hypothetical protein